MRLPMISVLWIEILRYACWGKLDVGSVPFGVFHRGVIREDRNRLIKAIFSTSHGAA